MKVFVVVAACLLLAINLIAADEVTGHQMLRSAYGGGGHAASAGSSYGGGAAASIPAPPCPQNYLFSCQPSLSPAPCSQSSSSYGSAGSYSDNYPVYAVPVPHPQYGYNAYQGY